MRQRTGTGWGGARLLTTLAMATLLTGCESEPSAGDRLSEQPLDAPIVRTDDPVVARVEGTEIYRTDVQRAAAGQGVIGMDEDLPESDPVFRTTLDELIDQRLLALDAVRSGVSETEEARRRLAAARDRILGNLRVETHLESEITEDAVRDLYQRQSELGNRGEERRARQIVLDSEDAAAAALTRLQEEEDFDALVAELSTDENSREANGNLGWLSRDMVAGPLRAAIFQTPVGERAGPVSGPEGWYVIEVLDSRAPGQRSFEDVREEIERFMTFQAIDSLMTDLRDTAEIDRLYLQDASAETESPDPEASENE